MTIPLCLFHPRRFTMSGSAAYCRVLPRVLLCKTWRCGLTCDGRAVSTSRGGALSASRAPLKAVPPPVPSPLPSSRLLSRPISLSFSLSPRVASNILYASVKTFFGLFRRPRLYKWDRGKRPCCEVASSDTRNGIVYRRAINLGAGGFLRAL